MRSVVILSLLFLTISSCYEREEGCLDFRANNYDFGADDPCEDCCTFPTLRLTVNHEWGDTTLFLDSIYQNGLNQFIRIVESKFYITNLILTSQEGSASVPELISIEDLTGGQSEISAANALVQSNRFNYDLGTFELASLYEGLNFTLGVDGMFTSDDFDSDAEMFDDSTYIYTNFRLEFVNDQISGDTMVLELNGMDTVLPIKLSGQIDVPLGENFSIPLQADYQKLLDDIDIDNILSSTEKEKVRNNLVDFLSIQ